MRLFTALWPPREAVEHLASTVDASAPALAEAAGSLRKFRMIPPERWHVTLCFHGEAEPEPLGDRLARGIGQDRPGPPSLRLAEAGTFRGVLWVGLHSAGPADAAALGALVDAAGADSGQFRAHVTVARWAAGREGSALVSPLAGYAGPWWSAHEVALVRSDLRQGAGGPIYTTVRSVPVTGPAAGAQGRHNQC